MWNLSDKQKKAIAAIIVAISSLLGITLASVNCLGTSPEYSGSVSGSVGFGSDAIAPIENMELLPLSYNTIYILEDGRSVIITDNGSVTFPDKTKGKPLK